MPLVLLGLVATLHLYIGLRLGPWLALPAWSTAIALVCLLAAIAYGVWSLLARRNDTGWRAWLGPLALGFFSSLLVLTLARELLLLVNASFRAESAAAVPLLALLASTVGLFNARRPSVRYIDVPIHKLSSHLQGFTVAQISDLHVGATIRSRFVQRVVETTNALNPDLTVITGDTVDGQVQELREHTAPLRQLQARHGVFAVTGNHEYYSGAEPWIAEFRRLGLTVLMNEHVLLEHGDAHLVLAGVADFTAHHFEPAHRSDPMAALIGMNQTGKKATKILLAHQPRSAQSAQLAGFDLQLSGHTHGGQFFPWNFFVPLQQPFTAGLHRLGQLWIYVSRGTGYWGPPKRLWAPAEISLIRLVRAPT